MLTDDVFSHADPEALGALRDLNGLSDASPLDLSHQQIKALRDLFEDRRVGLYLFSHLICGHTLLIPQVHLPICQLLGRWGESVLEDGTVINRPVSGYDPPVVESFRRLMIRIPRDTFKTTLCTIDNTLWQLACDPDHALTFGIFNEKAENSQAWVGAIADIVESSLLFQIIWREMIPKGIGFWDKDRGVSRPRNLKWGNTGIRFERNLIGQPQLSIEPHGIGGAVTGKHYTHKVLDDIIGEASAHSQAVMQDAVNWFDNSRPLERPANKGCEIVVHTPWAHADVYAHALKRHPNEYKVHVRHLLEDTNGNADHINGESIIPEKFSTLEAKRLIETDPFVNMAQYQCIPRAGREMSFDDSWYRFFQILQAGSEPILRIRDEHYDPKIVDIEATDQEPPQLLPLSWLAKALIIDPAPSKDSEIRAAPNSDIGMTLVGVDPWHRRFLLDTWAGRDTPTEVLWIAMALCHRWHTRQISIEEVVFSAVYAPLWETILSLDPRYEWSPEWGICKPGGRQKDVRIKDNLIPPMENGFWYFNQTRAAPVIQQLSEFPHGEKKDLIDALSYTDEQLDPSESPSTVHLHAYERRRAEQEGRGPTGYGAFF